MANVRRLVYSIIEFLGDQLAEGNLTPDAAESLEVAVQCLENAYAIEHDDPQASAALAVPRKLIDIFNDASDEPTTPTHELTDGEKSEAERLKNHGNQYMKEEKFNEALEYYSKAIKIDSRNAIYYCNRAAAYSKLGKHAAAIEDCRKAIAIDPNYSKAYGRMGLAHSSLNQTQEAKDCFEKAVQLDPDNESYLNNLKITEDKLRETNLGPQNAASGGAPGFGLDLSNLLGNPALMNMATQMMTDPSMQHVMRNFLSGTGTASGSGGGGGGGGGVEALLQAGQQLAQQMQNSNPQLVEQLRRHMNTPNSEGQNQPDGDKGNPP